MTTTDRPREWGWVIRPSTGAWQEFIHTTDKLLSENIRHGALDAAGAPKRDAADQTLGTLARLERLLVEAARVDPEAREVMSPLRFVRNERQTPAHHLAVPTTDAQTAARQRDLLSQLGDSLESVRVLLSRHPKASGWRVPEALKLKLYRL